MKEYYYCYATNAIYTKREMEKSVWPIGRFVHVGAFKNRTAACQEWDENHPMDGLSYTGRTQKGEK